MPRTVAYTLPKIVVDHDDHGNKIEYQQQIDGSWRNLYDQVTVFTDCEMRHHFSKFFTVELSPVTMGEPLPVAAAA